MNKNSKVIHHYRVVCSRHGSFVCSCYHVVKRCSDCEWETGVGVKAGKVSIIELSDKEASVFFAQREVRIYG
jgi:hypothetical protein